VLGRSPEPAAEDAPLNPVDHVSWRPDHEQMVADANNDTLRGIVVRPGVVYGGGNGIVADLFKAASNGLVRVVGDGNNHWPLVYDRDLGDLYGRLVGREDAAGVYHANDEGDERVNDIVDAIKPYLPVKPDVRHVRLDADAAFGRRQRRSSARRVARVPELRIETQDFAASPGRSRAASASGSGSRAG
jgi:nucleoside-diphosphate-sugar epimerase